MIVEDEKDALNLLAGFLTKEGFEVYTARRGKDAVNLFESEHFDLVLLDIRLPDISGKEVIEKIKSLNPLTPVIVVSALQDVETVVEMLKKGAEDYITKPISLDQLLVKIKGALEKFRRELELRIIEEINTEELLGRDFVFQSKKMQDVLIKALKASKSNAPCLVMGETGTGKTLLARLIHNLSGRKNGPFVDVHLQAIPETLVESELFGYKKGAFTGADKSYEGLIIKANGGTLFLDEIGELKRDLQVKLLKVIEEKKVKPLGDTQEYPVDFRLITATNRDLYSLVKEGYFREDLYYRLNVIEIVIPPLRERREDIPILLNYFLKKYAESEGKDIEGFTKDAMELLLRYPYPGNVRELSNIVERACVMASKSLVDVEDLPETVRNYEKKKMLESAKEVKEGNLFYMVREFEKRLIINALKEANFVKTKAAKKLGISERVLRYKIKALGIEDGEMHSKG